MKSVVQHAPPLLLGLALLVSLGADGSPSAARSLSEPTPPDIEARLLRLEQLNARLLEQNESLLRSREDDRRAAEHRYADLERRYEELRRQFEGKTHPTRPAATSLPAPAPYAGLYADPEPLRPGFSPVNAIGGHVPAHSGSPARPRSIGLMGKNVPGPDFPLRSRLGDGFVFSTPDDEFELRLRLLDQNDAKIFVPNNQSPARSGLYIPRVRVYFEGQLSRPFEYEVSLQRSVEGVWDLLDANANFVFSEGFQIRFGRMLVPYSYAWYDHLEQYFIAPERALYPLNFGLARSSGVELHGALGDGRLEYAVGMFDGHLTGLADENSIRDGVGYLNAKPFLESDRFPALRHLNLGISGFVGQQLKATSLLPLRTSLQSSENDEAAQEASTIFFEFEDDVFGFGNRYAGAAHLAWYWRGWSLESEIQATRFDMLKAGRPDRPSVPVAGGHVSASYFLTGEHVTGRGPLDPLRPFDPARGLFGPGAFELFGRYSQIGLGQTVFDAELANPDRWTRDVYMTDIGINWYLNRYLKFYFDWQHANFGSPVLLNPRTGDYGRFADLFWIRCQIYF